MGQNIDDAVAAFLANGGTVDTVSKGSSLADSIADDAGLTDQQRRRLHWQMKSGRLSVEEARERYPSLAEQAMRDSEVWREQAMRSRVCGASTSEAQDDARQAVTRRNNR